ncbi:Uncharacterized protein FWK35_00024983 [Aphis craccivora]|uniref:Uncharacterized protein n=1 Tax=Aphis craccivora TaxID=307492 RepID=A0A6G0ZCZ3_APHCR|nr:Uncharacterized protein FWK35_00024983 [Aphis craccivora]
MYGAFTVKMKVTTDTRITIFNTFELKYFVTVEAGYAYLYLRCNCAHYATTVLGIMVYDETRRTRRGNFCHVRDGGWRSLSPDTVTCSKKGAARDRCSEPTTVCIAADALERSATSSPKSNY